MTQLPRRLVKANYFNHLGRKEKEAQIKDVDKDIRGWMVEVMTKNEYGMDTIKNIARGKLEMVEATMMPENMVASIFKATNILLIAFSKLKSALETFWGKRIFASENSFSQLRKFVVRLINDHWMNV